MTIPVEQGRFDHFRGKNFTANEAGLVLRRDHQSILGEYQQALIDYATHYGYPLEEASLPYVLACRLHTLRETYSFIGDSLGIKRNTTRRIYAYYGIPPISRGERSREIFSREGMKERLSRKAKEQAKRPEEIEGRAERGRKEMVKRWEQDPTRVKRSFAAARYLGLLRDTGITTAQGLVVGFLQDLERQGIHIPREVRGMIDSLKKELPSLEPVTLSYDPEHMEVHIKAGDISTVVTLKGPQAKVYGILDQNKGRPVPHEVFFPTIGATDRSKGIDQLRMIIYRLRRELNAPFVNGNENDNFIKTVGKEGFMLVNND